MKKQITLIVLAAAVAACISKEFEPYQSNYEPILMGRSGLEKAIKFEEPRAMVETGKIYVHNHLLLVNEYLKGVHVINNSDPSNPKKVGFINIPGCVDIAMKGNLLYADQAVDLVAIELGENSATAVNRVKNVFPELPAPDRLPYTFEIEKPDTLIIVNWRKK